MLVKEIMSAKVISLSPDHSLIEAAKLMTEKDIGFIVITNEKRIPLGVVTDRDMVTRILAKEKEIDVTIDEAATHNILSVDKDTPIEEAIQQMKDHQIRRLVVVNDRNEVVGVLSVRDIAICKYTSNQLEELMKGICLYNKKTYEPMKYVEVDSFPL